MSQLSDMGIPGVASGILSPKLVNRFRVLFEALGSDFTILSQQVVRVDGLIQSRDGTGFINIVIEDDISGHTLFALQQLWETGAFKIRIEHLDGNACLTNAIELRDCGVVKIRHGALDYAGGSRSPRLVLNTKQWMGPGIDELRDSSPAAAALLTLLNGATISMEDPELNAPATVQHTVVIKYGSITVS